MLKSALIILALIATVALPFALRPRNAAPPATDDVVVIITPNNEAIRHEYARGFAEWYRARTGRTVRIDWRVIGGTSDIARFLESEYVAAFERHWTQTLHRPWSTEIQAAFQNHRLATTAPAAEREARATFLTSAVSCGIDVFFGGGTYDFDRQADVGRIVDAGLEKMHPDWFRDDVIPQRHGGEEYWRSDRRWIGTVLSTYGIIFNREAWRRLGLAQEPRQWVDLTDPRLVGEIALADPTKSGSVAKAFENIIQKQMQRRLRALLATRAGGNAASLEAEAVRGGWDDGLRLIQLLGANARYFTDSSQKPPIDVADGNCAAGLCIDFYGRQQQEAVRSRGSERVGYVSPAGGATPSVDPVALLRGAPNRAVAVAFIEYSISLDGQKLWNFKPGTPGGPEHYALRRLPVRADFYRHAEWKRWRTDPDDAPYDENDPLVYRPEWTGDRFREMAFVIRVMGQDTHQELLRAWKAINAAAEPAHSQALAKLQDMSMISYERVGGEIHRRIGAKDKVEEIRLATELAASFRANYQAAEQMARVGR
jgi:iron(III) transport system substrate-binding protein